MKTYTKPELEAIFLEEIDVIATSSPSEETETPETLITWGTKTEQVEMSLFK